MSLLKKIKKVYDSIEIPQNLEFVVNKAINGVKVSKKNYAKMFMKVSTSVLATSFTLFVILLNINESFAQSMENIPIICNLAEVFTVREYKEENEIELIDAKIPAIKNTGNTELEEKINLEISNKIDKIIDEAKQRAKEYQEAVLETGGTMENYKPLKIDIDYAITYKSENIVSFVITKSETLASAYTEQYFYNIDINNSKELNLKDVLGKDYKEIVDAEVKKQIKEISSNDENKIYFEPEMGGFSGIDNEYHDFCINPEGKVSVVFQKYEIAPGYMGIQHFDIKDSLIK